jgi:outer membrane protein assembly factor BamE
MNIMKPIRFIRGLALALVLALLGACQALTPYQVEIQQGNIITDEGLKKLRTGMSKNQAALALGTPLLNDVFHANRWDYVHYVKKRGKMTGQKHVALIFDGEQLARLEGAGVAPLAPEEKPPQSDAPMPAEPTNDLTVPEPEKK